MNLSSTIKSIQDIMRKDDGVDGDAQRLGQLTWMLFLKVFDQREQEWEKDTLALSKKYQSPLSEKYRWRNWAAYILGPNGKKIPQKKPSEVIDFVNNSLFPALRTLNPNISLQHKVIRELFEEQNNYMKSGTQMLAVIEKLEETIHFDDFKERLQLGDVYEQLLNDLRGAGNAGEFYTPRAITEFMVERVDPRIDSNEIVLDPACGTGGFLTAAIDHFRKQSSNQADEYKLQTLIRGIEKKQLPHLLCTTNMLLHGIDVPSQIEHKNTLSIGWDEWKISDQVTCLVTNPPFGGYEENEAGSDYPSNVRTRETADMFMALIIKKLLKENGRAAVVLPDNFLFGVGIKSTLKEMLLKDCRLHTIIRLPKGVFAPYTSIKTNLLFFTKGALVDENSEYFHTDNIWFYEHQYPVGYKSYSKTKPIKVEEFDPIKLWWGNEEDNFTTREIYDANTDFTDKKAWKYEFGRIRLEAVNSAQPHWDNAKKLNNEVQELECRLREIRDSIKGVSKKNKHGMIEDEIAQLSILIERTKQKVKEAQDQGDRIYWSIYNLDLKNPYKKENESQDPEILLEKYKVLLGQIEETESHLKSELASALAHHFTDEDL
ncbi:N-6 DNA methylase [Enterobacter dykesii]